MKRFPFPVLLADIGGTNARFALISHESGPVSPIIRLATHDFARFEDAAREAIRRSGWPQPATLLVGVAGAVRGRVAELTNAPWRIEILEEQAMLGLEQGLLLNDFEVLSLAVPQFAGEDLLRLGAAVPSGPGNRLVIGPGTGLGVGALVEAAGRLLPLSSEGGHVGLGPETPEEAGVFARLDLGGRRPQAEMLLAGPGLPALYRAVAAVGGKADLGGDTAAIVARALAGTDSAASSAVQFQLDLLARFAGDMALTFMATGGVYLAGGILPRIRSLIDPVRFRQHFERNAVHAALLAAIPVQLIVAEEPAFVGLAALARQPERYMLDYASRLWA